MTAPAAPLLRTKLFAPRPRTPWIARPRLVERLGGQPRCHVMVISAPAGYGKTTLLSAWFHHQPQALAAWLSLEPADNDPVRFWSYVVESLRTLPGIDPLGQGFLDLLHSADPPPFEASFNLLLNEITQLQQDVILALDDFHVVTLPQLNQQMAYFLNHLPPNLYLALATRKEPPFPLARLRAARDLVEIRAADLRFTPPETADFFEQSLRLSCSPEVLRLLDQRIEGWPAGLQLAALALGEQPLADAGEPPLDPLKVDRLSQNLSGGDRYLLDYLTEEVLHRQPAEVQEFLLNTAILDRFCAPLCDAVMQAAGSAAPQQTSQALIDRVENANLFIIPLDNQRAWYRYHHLFADLLRAHLQEVAPQRIPSLHRGAARWFWDHHNSDEAIQHALAAGDLELAATYVETAYSTALDQYEIETLLSWINAFPPQFQDRHPRLRLALAWAALYQIHFDQAERLALQALEQCRQPPAPTFLGQVNAILATAAVNRKEFEHAVELSRQALHDLPESWHTMRGLLNLNLGDAENVSNHFSEAEQAFHDAYQSIHSGGNPSLEVIIIGSLGDLYLHAGELHRAEQTLDQALQIEQTFTAKHHQPLVANGKIYAFLSRVYLEWAQFDRAQACAARAVEYCRAWGHAYHLIDASVIQADILSLRQGAQAAQEVLRQADRYVQELRSHSEAGLAGYWRIDHFQMDLALCRIHLALHAEDLGTARQNLDWVKQQPVSTVHYYQSRIIRCRAWLDLLDGHPQEAQGTLLRILEEPRPGHRQNEALLTLVLLALAYQKQGSVDEAQQTLARALTLAQPEDRFTVFLEKGPLMREALETLARRPEFAGNPFLNTLLSMDFTHGAAGARVPSPTGADAGGASPLIEPLSERERDMLRLLAAGRTYPEIASALYLSLNTVKTHVKRLYAHLGVSSRFAAIERAKEWKLI
jgi:LuxR family maltose regulon positive regulatory protein